MIDVNKTTDTLSRIFIPICKIDEEKRLVYGKMTFEAEDSAGEIWDYEGSKPYFEAWSANAEKTTGGKSLGNLRSMHQPIAAGKLTQFLLDDETKSCEIAAKVVDDAEWRKVLEGVYTGFSQGGRYVCHWKDPNDSSKTRYISNPVEVSLVDLPCLPGATFEYVKADGSVELRKFSTKESNMYEPTNEEVAARATELAKAAGDETKWPDHIEAARADLKKSHEAAPVDEPAAEEPAADAAPAAEVDEAPAAAADDDASKAASPEDDAGAGDPAPEADEASTEDADPEAQRKAARDSLVQVWLTPAQQKLLGTTAFVKAADAVSAIIGETEASPASPIDAALKAARGEDEAGEPEMVKFVPTEGLDVAKAALDTIVAKGIWDARWALEVLSSVICLQTDAAWEAEYEKDGSSVPAQLATIATSLGETVLAMCQEEIAEALANVKTEEVAEIFVTNADQAEFVKTVLANEELVAKIGARNSRKDAADIQKIHDNAVSLGAECDPADKTAVAEELAKRAETDPVVKAMVDENAELRAEVEKGVTGIAGLGEDIRKMREEIAALKKEPAPMAPRTSVVGKGQDNMPPGTNEIDVTKASEMIAELGKSQDGQRMLAEAAIRIAQPHRGA